MTESVQNNPEVNPKKKYFLKIFFYIFILYCLVSLCISIPGILEYQTRKNVSLAKTDLRTLSASIESYAIDNGQYPPMIPFSGELDNLSDVNPFQIQTINHELTTPIAYINSLENFNDKCFKKNQKIPYGYFVQNKNWVLISSGPDQIFQIDPEKDLTFYMNKAGKRFISRSENLINKIYDPTNGTKSRGDILRANSRSVY